MFYAIIVPPICELPDGEERPSVEQLVFEDIKQASAALKRFKGSRMKTFTTKEKSLDFLYNPALDESFIELDSSCQDIVSSLEKLSLQQQQGSPQRVQLFSKQQSPSQKSSPQAPTATIATITSTTEPQTLATNDEQPEYPSVKPALLNQLRRKIESGDYEFVHDTIWENPKCLVTVCDSAVYLMAGPKYNACHIAARANKPDIMALILDTISNFNYLRKLYPLETSENIQHRVNHLLDSYLNTRDPRLGNTPLHFACKMGHYQVVRVLLTFEGCDLTLRDSNGKTAEESICTQDTETISRIKSMFKHGNQLHSPLSRDRLKKRLLLSTKKRNQINMDADESQ